MLIEDGRIRDGGMMGGVGRLMVGGGDLELENAMDCNIFAGFNMKSCDQG